jgi:hypothetical protein
MRQFFWPYSCEQQGGGESEARHALYLGSVERLRSVAGLVAGTEETAEEAEPEAAGAGGPWS